MPKTRLKFYAIGLAILLVGFGGAGLVWHGQPNEEIPSESAPLAPLDSKKDTQQIEIYYGKGGLLLESATGYFRGKRLAELMVIGSAIGAIGCFIIAGRRSS